MSPRPFEADDDRSTLLQRRVEASEPPQAAFVLRVAAGPDVSKALHVEGDEPAPLRIGKSASCALVLTDPAVSRAHATVQVAGRRLQVRDLESLNGTFVGDAQIHDAVVDDGCVLRLGSTLLHVERVARNASEPLSYQDHFGRLFGASREMRRLYPLCERLAASTLSVVIEGETGTGKEVLAEALHERGPCAAAPFVVFDCTAAPPNLIESELFGHEKGAFTGATLAHRGVFEQADGGTLLLDEIGDLPLAEQVKLLRVMERTEFRRVGGERAIRPNVRLLAATRRSLEREVEKGRFRDDLFHRLAVARVELPPLRERKGDISLLACQLWTALGGTGAPPAEALARWERHSWPGNVRELRNAVARFLTLGTLDAATTARPPAPAPGLDALAQSVIAQRLPLAVAREHVGLAFERRYLEEMLSMNDGVVTRAAERAGVARRHFHRLLQRAGLTRR